MLLGFISIVSLVPFFVFLGFSYNATLKWDKHTCQTDNYWLDLTTCSVYRSEDTLCYIGYVNISIISNPEIVGLIEVVSSTLSESDVVQYLNTTYPIGETLPCYYNEHKQDLIINDYKSEKVTLISLGGIFLISSTILLVLIIVDKALDKKSNKN